MEFWIVFQKLFLSSNKKIKKNQKQKFSIFFPPKKEQRRGIASANQLFESIEKRFVQIIHFFWRKKITEKNIKKMIWTQFVVLNDMRLTFSRPNKAVVGLIFERKKPGWCVQWLDTVPKVQKQKGQLLAKEFQLLDKETCRKYLQAFLWFDLNVKKKKIEILSVCDANFQSSNLLEINIKMSILMRCELIFVFKSLKFDSEISVQKICHKTFVNFLLHFKAIGIKILLFG